MYGAHSDMGHAPPPTPDPPPPPPSNTKTSTKKATTVSHYVLLVFLGPLQLLFFLCSSTYA